MAYSRFTNRMRRLFWAHVEADARGMPVDEVLGAHQERAKTPARFVQETLSRRAFLRRLGVMGTAAAMGYALQPGPTFGRGRGGNVRVVIIGAGLAGLQCAHQLAQNGVQATVYEAADRIGGRVLSDTITFDGIVAEHGGAFISTEHTATRYLAQTLGLDLEVIHGGALLEGEELYLIDGDFYTLAEANQDWSVAWKAFQTELQAAPFPQTFEAFTQRGLELDQIAIPEWFDPTSPFSNPILSTFGPDSRFAQLCYSDAIAEYGGDHTVQPALNLLYLLAWNPRNSITPLPGTDEQYRIVGGTEQLAQRMAEDLPDHIQVEKALEAILGSLEGPYTCHFADGSTAVADKLVLALPFRMLREVAIDERIWQGLTPPKQLAIAQMPMGTNAKIHLELSHRTWGPGFEREINGQPVLLNGVSYSDPAGFQCVWDDSVPVAQGPVILLDFPGGTQGAHLQGPSDPFGPADPVDVKRVLSQVEVVFPGTSGAYTGRSLKSFWAAAPWQKGAYAFWGIGGYTSYVGAAARQEGNLHFAGEHTSVAYQGFMEGAVRSGLRVAQEILQDLGPGSTKQP
jgi:monoamine oxidase